MLISWGLAAVAAIFLCIANSWLIFLGLALLFVSGLFSSNHPRRWPWNLISWLCAIAAIVFLAWLTSYGRHPLDWPFAAFMWVIMVAHELNWGTPRKADGA